MSQPTLDLHFINSCTGTWIDVPGGLHCPTCHVSIARNSPTAQNAERENEIGLLLTILASQGQRLRNTQIPNHRIRRAHLYRFSFPHSRPRPKILLTLATDFSLGIAFAAIMLFIYRSADHVSSSITAAQLLAIVFATAILCTTAFLHLKWLSNRHKRNPDDLYPPWQKQ